MLFHLFHKNTKLRRLSTLHIVEGWLSLSLFFFLLMLPKRSFLLPSILSWKKIQKLTQQSNEACSYFFIGNILSSCQLLRYRLVINLWADSIGGTYFNSLKYHWSYLCLFLSCYVANLCLHFHYAVAWLINIHNEVWFVDHKSIRSIWYRGDYGQHNSESIREKKIYQICNATQNIISLLSRSELTVSLWFHFYWTWGEPLLLTQNLKGRREGWVVVMLLY